MSRKPWEIPIQYNDWFPDEPGPNATEEEVIAHSDAMHAAHPVFTPKGRDEEEEEVFGDIDEDDLGLMDADERGPDTQSKDNTPIDYSRGPHDDEFGIDEDYDPEEE